VFPGLLSENGDSKMQAFHKMPVVVRRSKAYVPLQRPGVPSGANFVQVWTCIISGRLSKPPCLRMVQRRPRYLWVSQSAATQPGTYNRKC